jgi:hypothetical protein
MDGAIARKFCEAQRKRTRKSNKDFVYTTLDIWYRLHISLECSLNNNTVLDTMIENLVATTHKKSDDVTPAVLEEFVEKMVLREPRFRSTGQLRYGSLRRAKRIKAAFLLQHCLQPPGGVSMWSTAEPTAG